MHALSEKKINQHPWFLRNTDTHADIFVHFRAFVNLTTTPHHDTTTALKYMYAHLNRSGSGRGMRLPT